MLSLRHGTATASLGADDDLEYLVTRLRAAWPNVRIRVRGDGGFGMPTMYEVCERLERRLHLRPVDQRRPAAGKARNCWREAVRGFGTRRTTPQRLFAGFWYQAGSWPAPRWVMVKAEANAQGTNRRFVVTNRPGASVCLEATYDEYAMRGESENRNKELKCGVGMDRLSDHRFVANLLPAVPARGGVEPAGAVASGDRRPAAGPGERAGGGVWPEPSGSGIRTRVVARTRWARASRRPGDCC